MWKIGDFCDVMELAQGGSVTNGTRPCLVYPEFRLKIYIGRYVFRPRTNYYMSIPLFGTAGKVSRIAM